MAKARKSIGLPLKKVQAGDAFLMRLEDGRLGVCRVLQTTEKRDMVLACATPWIGTAPPDLSEPQLRAPLRLMHHRWDEPCVRWVCDPVPPEFQRLGVIAPSPEEAGMNWPSFSDWTGFAQQLYLQWRWDHQREAVLSEDAEAERQQQAAQEAQLRAYQPLPRMTLEQARKKRHFEGWVGYFTAAQVRNSRLVIHETINALIALGPDAPEPAKIDVFRQCVERFNELDLRAGWIETTAREDICDLLDELAGLVGLDDYDDSLTGNRDW